VREVAVVELDRVLFDDVVEVTVRPLLFDQCGSFTPIDFPQYGQIPDADDEVAEYVDRLDFAVLPERQLSQT
jgi:hypothetical protein